jgi:ADP-ribosylglycohydrolase
MDTTGAVFGQLAGAYYGVEAIPFSWRERVTFSEKIVSMAELLLAATQARAAR